MKKDTHMMPHSRAESATP